MEDVYIVDGLPLGAKDCALYEDDHEGDSNGLRVVPSMLPPYGEVGEPVGDKGGRKSPEGRDE